MVGTRIQRNENGDYVVNASGNYVEESVMAIDANGNEVPLGTEGSRTITPIIGNPEPDYVMNIINTIKYKDFTLGWQLSHTSGGDMISKTIFNKPTKIEITQTENFSKLKIGSYIVTKSIVWRITFPH